MKFWNKIYFYKPQQIDLIKKTASPFLQNENVHAFRRFCHKPETPGSTHLHYQRNPSARKQKKTTGKPAHFLLRKNRNFNYASITSRRSFTRIHLLSSSPAPVFWSEKNREPPRNSHFLPLLPPGPVPDRRQLHVALSICATWRCHRPVFFCCPPNSDHIYMYISVCLTGTRWIMYPRRRCRIPGAATMERRRRESFFATRLSCVSTGRKKQKSAETMGRDEDFLVQRLGNSRFLTYCHQKIKSSGRTMGETLNCL